MKRLSPIPFLLFSFALFAQDTNSVWVNEPTQISVKDLLEIKIDVATTQNTDLFNTPSTVSVIDKQMLRVYNFNDIAEAIQVISGMNLGRTYFNQQVPTSRWILQDQYSNKVLVMLNGIPQWNAATGEAGVLNRVSISDVERIEVLKGPASVLYGANAYSGAINIVLRNKLEKTSGNMRGTVGTANYFNGGASYNYYTKDVSYYISVTGQSEKGTKRTFTDEDSVTGTFYDFINYHNMTSSVRYKNHELTANGYNESQQFMGYIPSYSGGLGKPHNHYGYLASYHSSLPLNEKFKLINQVGYDWQQRVLPRNHKATVVSEVLGDRTSAMSKIYYEHSDELNAELGISVDYRRSIFYRNIDTMKDSILSHNNMKGQRITEGATFAQIAYGFGKFKVLAGDRFTINNRFGNNNSARSTLLFAFNKHNLLKFIYGQSFRAPSIFETFFVRDMKDLAGNTKLKPETSTSYEIAYLTFFNNFIIQTLAYYAVYDNKIFRVTKPYATLPDGTIGTANAKQYANGGQFEATGLECEIKYQERKFNAFATYNYVAGTKGDTIGTGNIYHYNFKYVPHHSANMGAALLLKHWNLSALANYVSKTQGGLVTNGKSETVPEWFNVNFNIGFLHTMGNVRMRHILSVKNIFNNVYHQPEFVNRTLASVPTGINRRFNYSVGINF